MSSLYIKSKRWCIAFRFAGKQYRRSLKIDAERGKKTINKLLAKEIQTKIDNQLAEGEFPNRFSEPNKQITLSAFLKEFREFLKKQPDNFAVNTVVQYNNAFCKIEQVLNGGSSIRSIRKSWVRKTFLPHLSVSLKNSTVKLIIGKLRSAFNHAIEWEYIEDNPFAGIQIKVAKTIPKFYSKSELAILHKYFKGEWENFNNIPKWQGEMVFLMLNTGLRKTEAAELKWENIFLELGKIKIRGKGKKERVIPLFPDAKKILENRIKDKKNARVFGEIKNHSALTSAFKKMKKRTGLGGGLHQLRKTFASYQAIEGIPPQYLKDWLGHSSLKMVMIYYQIPEENLIGYKGDIKGFKY